MRILIFGTGKIYDKYKQFFVKHEVVALLDNDKAKRGTLIDGYPVFPPERIQRLSYDRVYILSTVYFMCMKNQLIDLGVIEKNIYGIHDLAALRVPLRKNKIIHNEGIENRQCKGRILIVSNGFSRTGAPIAVFYAVRSLLHRGYSVCVVSETDGPLYEDYMKLGATAIIDPDITISYLAYLYDIKKYDLVILNTILFAYMLKGPVISIPIIWWIHDAQEFYRNIEKVRNNCYSDWNLSVYAVGSIAKHNFMRHYPDILVRELLYGIPDSYVQRNKAVNKKKIVFAIVGVLDKRKGQDVFLDAVGYLPEQVRRQCEFWIIGDKSTPFGMQMESRAQKVLEVRFLGALNHTAMQERYKQIDVLVCSSREDPMPVVVTEALMNHKTVLVPDQGIGNIEFIQDGVNGIVFQSNSFMDLSAKMVWAIQHPLRLHSIGDAGRKIYDKYFSLEVFEENLMRIIEEKLIKS